MSKVDINLLLNVFNPRGVDTEPFLHSARAYTSHKRIYIGTNPEPSTPIVKGILDNATIEQRGEAWYLKEFKYTHKKKDH